MSKKMLVSFILDETGSMMSVKKPTISGFNEYVGTLKNGDSAKDILFTLTQFNSGKVEIVHDGVKIKTVPNLTDETYNPNNGTPLYDAIGQTIRALESKVKGKKQRALIVIQTDGEENASREYGRDDIFSLIEEKKKKGWTFAFLGADQDAWLTGMKLGIDQGNVMSYKSSETVGAFRSAAAATRAYASSGGAQSSSLFEDIDK